jgi:hypothetical protein
MADALGVAGAGDAALAILEYCRTKIFGWLSPKAVVTGISDLERIVCEKLCLVIEEIWTDAGLDAAVRKYVALREFAFATLPSELDGGTFGTLYERLHVDGRSRDRFVAFIDCRTPDKAARRFFTRWHEIAHALTNYSQLQLPLKRSRVRGSPTERMMDAIAAEIGFFDPLFRPLLETELQRATHLTFAGVERLRDRFSRDASFQATLNTCVSRLPFAACVVEAQVVHKKSEIAALDSLQQSLFPPQPPPPKRLRLTLVVPNSAGRRMGLHELLRVPETSALWEAYHGDYAIGEGEDLADWEHSGRSLPSFAVRVEARRLDDRVLGLIQGC